MDFAKLSRERYSLRKFSDKPLEKEKLDLIQIVNHCPDDKDWNQLTTNEFISWLISVIDLL